MRRQSSLNRLPINYFSEVISPDVFSTRFSVDDTPLGRSDWRAMIFTRTIGSLDPPSRSAGYGAMLPTMSARAFSLPCVVSTLKANSYSADSICCNGIGTSESSGTLMVRTTGAPFGTSQASNENCMNRISPQSSSPGPEAPLRNPTSRMNRIDASAVLCSASIKSRTMTARTSDSRTIAMTQFSMDESTMSSRSAMLPPVSSG
jgi:hypothetical protein